MCRDDFPKLRSVEQLVGQRQQGGDVRVEQSFSEREKIQSKLQAFPVVGFIVGKLDLKEHLKIFSLNPQDTKYSLREYMI